MVDETASIRAALPDALGLGAGTGRDGPHLGCNRGLIVEFKPHVAAMILTQVGVIVMEPAYSLRQRIVTVVPIFDAALYEVRPGDVAFDADRGDDRVIGGTLLNEDARHVTAKYPKARRRPPSPNARRS